jgi:hypothetical protein
MSKSVSALPNSKLTLQLTEIHKLFDSNDVRILAVYSRNIALSKP